MLNVKLRNPKIIVVNNVVVVHNANRSKNSANTLQCARPFQDTGLRDNADNKNSGVHHTAESYTVIIHNKYTTLSIHFITTE